MLLAPAVILILGVLLFPMASAFSLSFTDLKLTKPDSGGFVGLDNYIRAFGDEDFWASLGRTTVFTVFTVVLEMGLGLAVAMLLNAKFRGRGFVRGLVLLPWALPYAVNGILWKWIFDANYGVMNAALTQTGIVPEYQIWLGSPDLSMAIVILANVWKETPVAVILLLASLQSLPREWYEAASIDGAGPIRKFTKITIPHLKPMILTLIIIKVIWALKEFDLIFLITKGGPANGTNLFSYYIYQNTFQYLDFGYGATLAYVLTFLAVVVSVLFLRSMKGEAS